MVGAHDYCLRRAFYDARQEELTRARDRFAVTTSSQHDTLNVGDFGLLQPA